VQKLQSVVILTFEISTLGVLLREAITEARPNHLHFPGSSDGQGHCLGCRANTKVLGQSLKSKAKKKAEA